MTVKEAPQGFLATRMAQAKVRVHVHGHVNELPSVDMNLNVLPGPARKPPNLKTGKQWHQKTSPMKDFLFWLPSLLEPDFSFPHIRLGS